MQSKFLKRFRVFLVLGATLALAGAYFYIHRLKWVTSERAGEIRQQRETASPEFTLFLAGDTGSGDEAQQKVAASMERRCQDLGEIQGLVLLGDNFYTRGVTGTDDPQWEEKVERPYSSPCLAAAPILPALGNHDYKGNTGAQIAYSRTHPRWQMPGRYYRLDFAKLLRLVIFDSGFPDFCFSAEHCAVDFLMQELKDSSAVWNLVAAHHPLSTASTLGYGYSGGIMGLLLRPLVCGKTDAWVSGHSHHLEHRKLPECDTDLFVSGGGGGTLYNVAADPHSLFAESSLGFLELKVSAAALNFSFYNEKGALLYQVQKQK